MAKNSLEFKEIEAKWRAFWEEQKTYKAKLSRKKIYSIDTPPPTVSGKMHIGHAFSYSQQDFIARFRRMYLAEEGTVFYPFGTDDNGLPTERLVEKINNVKSKNMTRAEFISLCLKTLKEITPGFVQDWKDLGISCDYDAKYSTIDKSTQKISQKLFLELLKKDLAYRKKFPTIWCPECQTSIAQAELEDKEEDSLFSTLKFKVGKEDLLIATTRPELLGACVCVFVNPADKRYKSFVGKKAKVPIFDFEVPILEDESAEIEKGTGVLMICSYGDKFDVDAINRHKLEPKLIMNPDGTLNLENYQGLKVRAVRKAILEDLKNADLIVEQKKISHIVNVHDKCGTPIEFISTDQWFIKILDIKKKLLTQAEKINWYPEYMKKRYDNWVNGLDWDWSVSRDRHFGIPIPVWYCEKCNKTIVPEDSELPVDPIETKKSCPSCNSKLIPETKVLDTWATSSISPQINSENTDEKVVVPFSLRPQAHDIIRTWAFYTIVRSYLHEGEIPWENIVISGNVSMGGEKMSKSKGNVIEPKFVLENYGADALRFWAAGSKLGSDLDYQEQDLVAGKKLVNKLTNAAKFVFMNLEGYDGKSRPKKLEKIDELFLEKLNILVKECTESFEIYEYSRAKSLTEQFFWSDFCDNYLEIVKKRVYQGSGDKKLSAQYSLYSSLLVLNKLFAPIIPFITEEVYQNHFRKIEGAESIHLSSWPKFEKVKEKSGLDEWKLLLELISKIRQEKSSNQKPMNSEIILSLDKTTQENLKDSLEDLGNVMNATKIQEAKDFAVEFVN